MPIHLGRESTDEALRMHNVALDGAKRKRAKYVTVIRGGVEVVLVAVAVYWVTSVKFFEAIHTLFTL